jgi:hypothetical protein
LRAVVQDANSPESTHAALAAAVNSGLDALSQVDGVLAATEAMERRPSASIWQALARRDESLQAALDLGQADVAALAAGRVAGSDLATVAPLSVVLFGAVSELRRGCTSVLFEARPCGLNANCAALHI